MTEKTLKVPDMSCGHCKAAVESELSKLSGVKRANDEGKVTTEDLKDAIEEAGYTVAA